jgi:hypothetical protein
LPNAHAAFVQIGSLFLFLPDDILIFPMPFLKKWQAVPLLWRALPLLWQGVPLILQSLGENPPRHKKADASIWAAPAGVTKF